MKDNSIDSNNIVNRQWEQNYDLREHTPAICKIEKTKYLQSIGCINRF